MALASDIDNKDDSEDAVVLMTLHSAKGLEFPVVFMPGMETGLFPGYRSFDSEGGIEEERRLCYVGITRAKERLFLSSAERRMLYGKTNYTSESIFLEEIDKKHLAGQAVYKKKISGINNSVYDLKRDFSKESYVSPIAIARTMQTAADRGATLAGAELCAGDRVEHPKFGRGSVLSVNGNVIEVAFDEDGIRKLAKSLAPLKKI